MCCSLLPFYLPTIVWRRHFGRCPWCPRQTRTPTLPRLLFSRPHQKALPKLRPKTPRSLPHYPSPLSGIAAACLATLLTRTMTRKRVVSPPEDFDGIAELELPFGLEKPSRATIASRLSSRKYQGQVAALKESRFRRCAGGLVATLEAEVASLKLALAGGQGPATHSQPSRQRTRSPLSGK